MRHKKPHIAWFHLYETSRKGNYLKREGSLLVAWDLQQRWAARYEGSYRCGGNVLKMDPDHTCTTHQIPFKKITECIKLWYINYTLKLFLKGKKFTKQKLTESEGGKTQFHNHS